MEKRGVSIFVFTIMFTLIAGAIILVFFFSFGKDLFSFSSKLTKAENLLVLEKNLASFALSSNSEKTITFSEDSYIDINCNSQGKFELQAEKTSSEETDKILPTEKLIFTPFQIRGTSVKAWTLAWNYPFKIDNLYFVADDKTTFYFPDYTVSSPDIVKYFVNKFKQTKFNIKTGPGPPNTFEQAVIVYFSNPPSPTPTNNHKIMQFVGLDGSNPQVKFWKIPTSTGQLPIWGDAMVYAAIFSADFDKFNDCVINGLAKQRIQNLVEIYQKTAPNLGKANNAGCNNEYTTLTGDSGFLADLATNSNKQEPAKKIKEANERLKSTECPVLFKGVETLRLI